MARPLDRLRRWVRGYRWWQWAIRIAAAVALLVILLYATLPWWLPTSLVAGRIETALEDALGVGVTIGDLSVGWRRGVRIASLTIADPLDPAAPALLTTGEISTGFAPLRLLFTQRLDRLTIRDPRVTLRTDAAGRWNLPAVRRDDDAGGLVVENIHISGGSVAATPPALDEPIRLTLADAQIRAGDDRPIEHATLTGHLLQEDRRVPVAASVTVRPTDDADNEIIVRGSFSGLDPSPLAALADAKLPAEKINRIKGTVQGTVVPATRGVTITDAEITLATADAPGLVRLTIETALVETADTDGAAAATVAATINVQAVDGLLATLVPGTPAATWLTGDVGGTVTARYREGTFDLSGVLGGEALEIRIPDVWRKGAGEPMRLAYGARLEAPETLSADAELQVAGATLTLRGNRRQGAWAIRGDLETDDARALLDETGLSGRLRVEADLQGLPTAPRGTVSVRAGQLDVGALRETGESDAAGERRRPPMTPAYRLLLTDRAREVIRTARRWTADTDITFEFSVARADRLSVAGLVSPIDATDLALEGTLANGRLEATGGASLQPARLLGRASTDLTETLPSLTLAASVENLAATGELGATVLELLPELEVRGGISREVELRIPLIDVVATVLDPRYVVTPVGQARTTLVDGLLRGLVPPEIIERVLPGLNLAAFVYDRADATTDYRADGTVENVATLTGDRYSLYIDGTVGPDGAASYDLGVIITGADDGPAWLQQMAGQRIPLFQKQFRLVDGRKVDESVTWAFPAESLRSLIENYLLRDLVPGGRGDRPNGGGIDLFDLLPVPGGNGNGD